MYGTPNWFVNRDPGRRKDYAEHLASGATALRDLDKEHVWRSDDYPHVIMFYFHINQIAKLYPELSTYLDAPGYLNRAWETARAFYTYPYEIYPSYYETYKWGLYNELVVLDVIAALDREGFPDQARWLRNQWKIKTKDFVYDDPYPFRSDTRSIARRSSRRTRSRSTARRTTWRRMRTSGSTSSSRSGIASVGEA